MTYQSAISVQENLASAIDEVVDSCGLESPPSLAVAFVSHEHSANWDTLGKQLQERLGGAKVIGCSGEGIIGRGQEVEEGPCLSLLTATLDSPEASVTPVRLSFVQTQEGVAFEGWPEELTDSWPDGSSLLLLADPFSFPADYLLARLNEDRPGVPVMGGMASGATQPKQNRLFLGEQSYDDGAVAWLLPPSLPVTPVVSQGCRPVGEKLIVTAAEQNRIQSLGGKPALEQLEQLFRQLPTHEQSLMQRGLHLGRVVDEYQDEFEIGDFLIRNVMGVDRESGEIAVGDYIRPGTTVQFHLRDESTASDELRTLVNRATAEKTPEAALIFSCNGRGTRLFSDRHHDATMISEHANNVPLAGFFAQGEFGPIRNRNFIHGFTASITLFDRAVRK